MIYALEGADGAGKTTLFEACRAQRWLVQYVPSVPVPPELRAVMPWVGARQGELWKHLYVPSLTYLCDRHNAVSGPVYDQLKGKPVVMDVEYWCDKVHVLYLEVPLEVLQARVDTRGDDFIRTVELSLIVTWYRKHLREFLHTVLDGTKPTAELVEEVRWLVK